MRKSFLYIAAITIFAACNKPETPVPASDTITARIEQESAPTKTYMDANNNVLWSSGDQIVGFMKSSLGLKYQILPSSVDKTWASFENVSGSNGNINAGTEWDHNVVYYPYSDAVEAAKSGSNYSLSVVLPSEQTYAPESFGEGSMAMVAVSEDNNITFRNVLGGMKLQLKGTQTVTSITLQGKNNEKLSGASTVTAYTDETKPAITMASGASTSVTLNCGSGVQLSESTATEFILALPPVLFSNGFTVTVTDSDSKTYTVDTDKANTVHRSSLLVMPEVTLGNSDPEESDNRWVDLGLSVLWATCNVGAASPEIYGGYYGWGETEEKYTYTWQSYKFYDYWSDSFNFIGYEISGTQYDVAHVKWGDGARMPTLNEVQELINNCTFISGTINGIKGAYVKGSNGNSIFLTNTGFRRGTANDEGNFGYYWSGSHHKELNYMDSYCINGNGNGYYSKYDGRHFGRAVRPVKDK